ncbi:helix-turn-helix domain-containing protein [Stomatohabitans albus]|uniref:winged helix-turn-helix transcriptional regulator n=1 Tax=Stomatohabitans albus TaxID=3110766 RepID=UPI00300DA6E0
MTERALPACGVARCLILLDGPWATLIIRELLHGPRRFNELRSALPGISAHTLTSRLRKFETHGVITRTAHAEVPPRVEYALTSLGESLRPVLDAMNTWGEQTPDAALTTGHRSPTPASRNGSAPRAAPMPTS